MSELILYLQSQLMSVTGAVGAACAAITFSILYYLSWQRARRPIPAVILGPLQRGRRETIRRPGNLTPLEVTLGDSSYAERLHAQILDRSLGGLGILLRSPFIVGTILRLRHAGAADSAAWVEVEVRRCLRHNGAWLVGCRFIINPSAEHLRLIG